MYSEVGVVSLDCVLLVFVRVVYGSEKFGLYWIVLVVFLSIVISCWNPVYIAILYSGNYYISILSYIWIRSKSEFVVMMKCVYVRWMNKIMGVYYDSFCLVGSGDICRRCCYEYGYDLILDVYLRILKRFLWSLSCEKNVLTEMIDIWDLYCVYILVVGYIIVCLVADFY